MEISFGRVKDIAQSLPIGFYAKEKISLDVDEKGTTSYYAPLENKIVIAYDTVCKALHKLENDDYTETAIRSILYHEVSHAIMTPKSMSITDIVNIFEDERIESVLSNYYYNVDFKKNVFYLNDYQGQDPANAMNEFYQTVRYRKGDKDFLSRVNKIVHKYSHMTPVNAESYSWFDNDEYSNCYNNYINDIYNLYNDIARKWGEETRNYYDDRYNNNGGMGGTFLDTSTMDEAEKKAVEGYDVDAAAAAAKDEAEEAISDQAGVPIEHIIDEVIGNYYDPKLTAGLEAIINTFNKKNSRGAALQSYSGVFNPRAVTRQDYRYFTRKATVNGDNMFGTFHLNLFLDDSGSMSGNENIVNKLLYSLICIEKSNPNFTFDVITCADRIEIIDKKKGYKARGGTYLSKKIIPLYNKVQKPNTYNYNLILFDGSASTDNYLSGTTFNVFDNNKCTIISDYSNSSKLNKLKTANVIYSNNYTEELIDNVYKTLRQAFR